MAFVRHRHGGGEGKLVFRTASGFSTASLAAQRGVVDLDQCVPIPKIEYKYLFFLKIGGMTELVRQAEIILMCFL